MVGKARRAFPILVRAKVAGRWLGPEMGAARKFGRSENHRTTAFVRAVVGTFGEASLPRIAPACPELSTRLPLALLTPDEASLFATEGLTPTADGTAAGSESCSHGGEFSELRTVRNPTLLFVLPGVLLLRLATRPLLALLFQLPPRITRFEPGGSSRAAAPKSRAASTPRRKARPGAVAWLPMIRPKTSGTAASLMIRPSTVRSAACAMLSKYFRTSSFRYQAWPRAKW